MFTIILLLSSFVRIKSSNDFDMASEIKTVDVWAIAKYRGWFLANYFCYSYLTAT